MSINSDAHKEDILHAAILEFGRMGYRAASTNEIVKNAKVSKGLLFHHFTNKEKLYTACQFYVFGEYGRFLAQRMHFSNRDFFDRVMEGVKIKMEFGRLHPEFMGFINRAWYQDQEDNPLERSETQGVVIDAIEESAPSTLFFDGLDTSLFREGMDLAKAFDYTRLVLEACWLRFSLRHNHNYIKMLEDMGHLLAEIEDIVKMLKYGAYTRV